jgi:hypothetical protein
MPLFRALEGVGGRDKPGQDEVSRPISLLERKIFPEQPYSPDGE